MHGFESTAAASACMRAPSRRHSAESAAKVRAHHTHICDLLDDRTTTTDDDCGSGGSNLRTYDDGSSNTCAHNASTPVAVVLQQLMLRAKQSRQIRWHRRAVRSCARLSTPRCSRQRSVVVGCKANGIALNAPSLSGCALTHVHRMLQRRSERNLHSNHLRPHTKHE